MDDTRPDITVKFREMLQNKTPLERMIMGFSMYETSKQLVARSIHENTPPYSSAELRQELFLKYYGTDFDTVEKQRIFDYFGSKAAEQSASYAFNSDHIPEEEKKQTWWRLLLPLINARIKRDKPGNSKLLKVLGNVKGIRTWKDVKKSIEIALTNVKDGEQILSRTSEIKKNSDPDGIIDDMFGELRTVPYLILKGFRNISYSRRRGLDFTAEFEGKVFQIESTYVHGPDFKTQEYFFTASGAEIAPIYKIRPEKLVNLFMNKYSKKEEQIKKYQSTAHNTFIFMITDLEETNAPWLDHVKIQGEHPLIRLILDWEIPTVIFGCGSVYEPIEGIFKDLYPFERQKFTSMTS